MFPIDLLTPPGRFPRQSLRDPADTARLLEATCRELAVPGHVQAIEFGPLVTTFRFAREGTRRYQELENLVEDLGIAVHAERVWIEPPRSGSTAGIQVPNPKRRAIHLRALLESPVYAHAGSPLTIALGTNAGGEVYMVDLATMPHLLVAGETVAGNSAGLVALLTTILHRATPDDVRLVLIDTAGSGLAVFEGIPHLLAPVIADTQQGLEALRWTLGEMERRFEVLRSAGVRNVVQYNRVVPQAPDSATGEPGHGQLPSIVVIISELAGLMRTAPAEIEDAIVRLAQMARAVGMHAVIATEDLSVGVLTGLIKGYLPARIAYRLRTAADSRTVVNCRGAERLLGNGDMLFLPPTSLDCIRLHGPRVSPQEASRVARYLRQQPRSKPDLLPLSAAPSVSSLQQQPGITARRAARLIFDAGTRGLG